jgi:glycerol-3-phosphate acyltransferase PlsY
MIWAVGFLAGLALGSIPFGVMIGRLKGVDIRAAGSGNIGATNVGRLLGTRWFFACFVLDMLKGLIPPLVTGLVAGTVGNFIIPADTALAWLAVMVAPVLGHMFSPFTGFRGGKGVATGVGALIGVMPVMTIPAVGALVVFLAVLGLWRYVSAASCVAAGSIPVWVYLEFGLAEQQERLDDWLVRGWPFLLAGSVLAVLVIYKHRSNLGRLLRGSEPKVGRRGADPARP